MDKTHFDFDQLLAYGIAWAGSKMTLHCMLTDSIALEISFTLLLIVNGWFCWMYLFIGRHERKQKEKENEKKQLSEEAPSNQVALFS